MAKWVSVFFAVLVLFVFSGGVAFGGEGDSGSGVSAAVPLQTEVEGVFAREVWTGIAGEQVASLTANTRFVTGADFVGFTAPSGPASIAVNSGERWRGYVSVPESGYYRFGIHADDSGELYLSADETPLRKLRVAATYGSTGSYQFRHGNQKSMQVYLESGRRYFMECLFKQHGGAARYQLSWLPPGTSTWVPLPEEVVTSFAGVGVSVDVSGFSLEWLAANNLTPGTLSPVAKQAGAFLDNWQSQRLGVAPSADAASISAAGASGAALGFVRELWFNAGGSSLAANRNKFLTPPDRCEVVLSGEDFSSQLGDSYFTRTRGYIVPEISGSYRFAVNGDDEVELRLSTDDSIAGARLLISSPSTPIDSWAKAAQWSSPVALVAGQRYYLEVRHREGAGDDFLRVAWQMPGTDSLEFLPRSVLRPFAPSSEDPFGFGYAPGWLAASGLAELSVERQAPWTDLFGDGVTNWELFSSGVPSSQINALLAGGSSPALLAGRVEIPGRLLLETWWNIPGLPVDRLVRATEDFRKKADEVRLHSGAALPSNIGDNYGRRARGYVTVPQTGAYHFYVTGDDEVALYIGEGGTKWSKERVAWSHAVTGDSEWTRFPSQKSRVFLLQAGQRIYVELLHKENRGSDFARIGWQTPDSPQITVVPAEVLSSYAGDATDLDDDDLPDAWEALYGVDANDNGSVNPLNGKHGVRNRLGLTNYQCAQLSLNPNAPDISALLGAVSVKGSLLREYWGGLGGVPLSGLKNNAKFAAPADSKTFVQPSGFGNIGDNYGERWRGWLTVEETGAYQLGVCADDTAELWLSTDAQLQNKRRIANVRGSTASYGYKYAEQKSLPVELVAGQRYYVEVLFKEATGNAFCQLTWKTPWESEWEPLPNTRLTSWVEDSSLDRAGFPLAWLARHGLAANTLLPDGKFSADSYLTNWEACKLDIHPGATFTALASMEISGWVREFWFGSDASAPPLSESQNVFLGAPAFREVVFGGGGFSSQVEDAYLSRTRGYLVPQTSGAHRFAVNADDEVEFWLSTDANPAHARRLINTRSWTAWDSWTDPLQQSVPVQLQAGQKYYVEIRHRDAGGTDFLRVAWQTPGSAYLDFIPASAMRVFATGAEDPHGFGYPQTWLDSTGLSALSLAQQAPWADPTGGGLTNLEKYTLGLNPLSLDSDGDGISDYEEVRLAHTNPAVADFDGTVETVWQANGADFLPPQTSAGASQTTAGAFATTGTSAYATAIRGALSYDVNLSTSGVFRLFVTGGQHLATSPETTFQLDIYIDNHYAGRTTLSSTAAALWLPHLSAGAHTLRVVWLNATIGSSLRIDHLSIEQHGGTWLSARQNALSGMDTTPASTYTSPYCLEGRAPDASLLTLASTYTPAPDATTNTLSSLFALLPRTALQGSFYADIPLAPPAVADSTTTSTSSPETPTQNSQLSTLNSITTVTLTDHATGATHAKTITWLPYDLATQPATELHLRLGETLFLQSPEPILHTHPDCTTETLSGAALVSPDTEDDSASPSPTTHSFALFATPGTHTLATTNNGELRTLAVHVASANLQPAPTLILGQARAWTPAALASTAELYTDPGLQLTPLTFAPASSTAPVTASSSTSAPPTFSLYAQTTLPQTLLARLGEDGPILDSTQANTLQNTTRSFTTLDTVQVFEDGTALWKATLSLGGAIPPDLRIKLSMYKAGSLFDDGTTVRWLTAADFDSNGTYTYYMLLPTTVQGSACHSALYYAGDTLLSNQL